MDQWISNAEADTCINSPGGCPAALCVCALWLGEIQPAGRGDAIDGLWIDENWTEMHKSGCETGTTTGKRKVVGKARVLLACDRYVVLTTNKGTNGELQGLHV